MDVGQEQKRSLVVDVTACVVGSVVSEAGLGICSMDIVEHDTTLLHVTKLNVGWLDAMTMLLSFIAAI
ncbi:hypothetical protein PWE64_004673 [Salmonella enterica]|nr:hypothetical protein [Salmonella enterica]